MTLSHSSPRRGPTLVLAFTIAAAWPSKALTEGDSVEPALILSLCIQDVCSGVEDGKAARFRGRFVDPEVTLRIEPYRLFSFDRVSFRYPRHFTFEADLGDPASRNWTLSGNDFKAIYFVLKGNVTPRAFLGLMLEKFGNAGPGRIKDAETPFGPHRLQGASATVTVADHALLLEAFTVATAGSETRLLVLQDNAAGAGGHSKEGAAALELLKNSFRLGP